MLDRVLRTGFSVAEGRHLLHETPGGAFQPVTLPHDAVIRRKRDQNTTGGGSQGFFDCYHDWTYRGTFCVTDDLPYHELYFEGVYRNSEIYVNGARVGGHRYGYTSFAVNVSNAVQRGENRLEVYVDNRVAPACRWYSGAGVYRDVHLRSGQAARVRTHGLWVDARPNGDGASLTVHADVTCDGESALLPVRIRVSTSDGTLLAETALEVSASAGQNPVTCPLELERCDRWSLEQPNLYTLDFCLPGGEITSARFGVRELRFAPGEGFFLNGVPTKLQGVDLHHDSGCVGSAFYASLWRLRIERLKMWGVNCIRTSHNPQAPAFYDLCDELGVLVYDEAFDKWNVGRFNYTDVFDEDWKDDLTAMIERDRNHPSVIVWSVGNEVQHQGEEDMIAVEKMLVERVCELDDSRPVTFAMEPHNSGTNLWRAPYAEVAARTKRMMDVLPPSRVSDGPICAGNYSEHWYASYHALMPDALVLGTEIFQWYSTIGTEGLYDLCDTHPWEIVRKNPWVIGGIIWSGTDYLGESVYWPARGWTGAPVDIAYCERPAAGLWKAYWSKKPTVSLAVFDPDPQELRSAPWWGCPNLVCHTSVRQEDGQMRRIVTFTNCESVELWMNGERLGERKADGAVEIYWRQCLNGQTLTAVGKNGGIEVCRDEITGFGRAADFRTCVTGRIDPADQSETALVEVELYDRDGRRVYGDERQVSFLPSASLEVIGVDNGDPNLFHDGLTSPIMTCHGRAAAVVRAKENARVGTVQITVDGVCRQQVVTLL